MVSIGFSTTNMALSKLIRWVTKAPCSHTFIIFDWLGSKWVLEAGFFGVVAMPYERFTKNNIIVSVVDLPGIELDSLKPVLEEMGEAYDFGGLIGGFFPVMGTWFKKKWSNPWDNTKALFCSELVAGWLKLLNFEGFQDINPPETTPKQIWGILSA